MALEDLAATGPDEVDSIREKAIESGDYDMVGELVTQVVSTKKLGKVSGHKYFNKHQWRLQMMQ